MVNSSCWRAFQFVTTVAFCGVCTGALRAEEALMPTPKKSLLQQLDPTTRAKVLMALLGLILLGITLIAVVCIGARYVRRVGTTQFKQRAPAPTSHKDIISQQRRRDNVEDSS